MSLLLYYFFCFSEFIGNGCYKLGWRNRVDTIILVNIIIVGIGQIGNLDHGNVKLGKAGRKRHKGIRPTVRGSAMSPRDHPHGGGEGRQPIGLPGPKSPWGKPTLGYKTRRNKKTDQYIVRRRSKKSR